MIKDKKPKTPVYSFSFEPVKYPRSQYEKPMKQKTKMFLQLCGIHNDNDLNNNDDSFQNKILVDDNPSHPESVTSHPSAFERIKYSADKISQLETNHETCPSVLKKKLNFNFYDSSFFKHTSKFIGIFYFMVFH